MRLVRSTTVEPKIDGVAVSLTFERGKLTRAVTRGDGEEGDDVTVNVRTLRGLPQALKGSPAPEIIEIRGEIFFRAEEFRRINQQQEEAGHARGIQHRRRVSSRSSV